jgi:hypothetical protein
MQITQLHTLINTVSAEVLGTTALVNEDLSNVVDIGKNIVDSNNVDNYVKKLVNHIGKVIFVNRLYAGGVPSVLIDSWEYGSVLEKVTAELPTATENGTWNLQDGTDYSPDVFYQPKVSAKFFNSKVTFEIPVSFTEIQVKESFSSAAQLNGFISMLVTGVENSMTVKLDALIMRTISNMIGETLAAELTVAGEIDPTKDSVKAVNLLKSYNTATGKTLAADKAISDADFIRYATYVIGMYQDRMSKVSTLFNIGAKERFTPKDMQHVVLLSDFSKASETFLLSGSYNQERVALPVHESVPFWQGSGLTYSFDDVSRILVKTSTGKDVDFGGIIGIIFDRDAVGVSNLNRRVTTNYNPKAEFYTNFYKFDAGYYNDLNENFVVFFIA